MYPEFCRRAARTAGMAAALLVAACGQGPAESQQQALVQAGEPSGTLRDVSVRPFPYHGLGSLTVWAYPEGGAGDPVRVRIRTTGGDEEQMELRAASGTLPRQLVVAMRDGRHVASLRGRMNASRLRFGSFGVTGENGLLHVVGGDPEAALAQVRGWPEVRSASPNAVVSLDGEAGRVWPVIGALPMDEADPVAGNGTLELRPGETASVEYRAADGALASVEQPFNSRSEPDMGAMVPLLAREVERALYGNGAAPPLLIDAESFAQAAWTASGTRITAAEAVAGLPSGVQVVAAPRGARCRGSVFPRDCSDVSAGTFLYTTGMFRTAVRYEMMASFRAPGTPPGCLWQQGFTFSWMAGSWRVEPGSLTRC